MNLDNVNVPNEAEVAQLEAVKESVRAELQAAAEATLAIDRTQHTGQLRMAQRLAASHTQANCCTSTALGGWPGTAGAGRRLIPVHPLAQWSRF